MSWRADEGGGALVEFAIVAPVLCAALMGILFYGGYFWTAHSIQQLANDSARAAIAGLDADERQEIAESTLASELDSYPSLNPDAASVSVTDESEKVAVNVSYDASGSAFYALANVIPMPSSTITRQAVVRLGGY